MAIVIDRLRLPLVVKVIGKISTIIATYEHIQDWKKEKERVASVQRRLIVNGFKAASQDTQLVELDCPSKKISGFLQQVKKISQTFKY